MSIETFIAQTDANQALASDPQSSAWVSANAGAGKTTVLVRRVLRLLLHADAHTNTPTRPENILCLTYTKAAAGEMKNRLFEELAHWATCDDETLEARLEKLTGEASSATQKTRARALFALTLDTPGGLKIYTIHAFCERLLHRFPLEAGVTSGFRVLDDQERQSLLNAAINEVLEQAAQPDDPLYDALREIASAAGDDQFRDIIGRVLGQRDALRAIIRVGGNEGFKDERSAIAALLGAPAGADEATLLADMAGILDDVTLRGAIAALKEGIKTDIAMAAALQGALNASVAEDRVTALEPCFLTQKHEKRKRLITNRIQDEHPQLTAILNAAQENFFTLAKAASALHIARATASLLALSDAVFDAYEERKRLRAALDYDDLIEKAGNLLGKGSAAAWVLYKLDYGIDHVLVDEAQDTSPAQWRVITALTGEFFSGEGLREAGRTVFAVGDEKQSIYSFQGADPAAFAAQGRHFADHARAADAQWKSVPLTVSFRSTSAVLDAVDKVFEQDDAAAGLSFDGSTVVHQAVRSAEPGLIEIWPSIAPGDEVSAEPFRPHEEKASSISPVDQLARRIAQTIADWLDPEHPEILTSQGRPIRAGDILILLRRRDPFTRSMIRELKARNIPVAGADRMRLTQQLAVMDLMALTDFLLMTEDDLALANVLKSPLFGLDDDDLFVLAHGRKGSLWQSLRNHSGDKDIFMQAAERLKRWLSQADYCPPYEFFAGLLEENAMEMRHALIARLGADAGDALDEFLNMALAYERDAPVSLQGFLDYVASSDAEVKRDMEQARDEVRIMTVHGAKGLEAQIVFLPDTCTIPSGARGATILPVPRKPAPPGGPDHIVWVPAGSMALQEIDEAKEARSGKEREEYHRLLYVAMTRARDRLYICGWENSKGRGKGCWHDLVSQGLQDFVCESKSSSGGSVLRHESAAENALPAEEKDDAPRTKIAKLPDWALERPLEELPKALPVAPSALLSSESEKTDKSLTEQSILSPLQLASETRFLRGTLIHTLLQHLPGLGPEEQRGAAQRYIAARGRDLDEKEKQEIISETLGILTDPDFSIVFGPDSLAEVPMAALFARESESAPAYEISGKIDRIAILDDIVLIIDYKTNRPPPARIEDAAPAYLAQLAAYRAGIRMIFPEKEVRAALLWTHTPVLMQIPAAMLDESEVVLRSYA